MCFLSFMTLNCKAKPKCLIFILSYLNVDGLSTLSDQVVWGVCVSFQGSFCQGHGSSLSLYNHTEDFLYCTRPLFLLNFMFWKLSEINLQEELVFFFKPIKEKLKIDLLMLSVCSLNGRFLLTAFFTCLCSLLSKYVHVFNCIYLEGVDLFFLYGQLKDGLFSLLSTPSPHL